MFCAFAEAPVIFIIAIGVWDIGIIFFEAREQERACVLNLTHMIDLEKSQRDDLFLTDKVSVEG